MSLTRDWTCYLVHKGFLVRASYEAVEFGSLCFYESGKSLQKYETDEKQNATQIFKNKSFPIGFTKPNDGPNEHFAK